MRIVNNTSHSIIAEETHLADTPFKRMKGLLGEKELKRGQALIIKPCNSIHTFFMRFPIDVLFVDKNDRVIKAISSLSPFRLTYIYLNSQLAIELPAGAIQSTSTHEGDIISVVG